MRHSLAISFLIGLAASFCLGGTDGAESRDGEERQLVFVYIGAQNCGICKTAAMKSAVSRSMELLAQQAEEQGRSFLRLGVATDPIVENGLKFLADYEFDEISVGGGWSNLAILKYLSRNPDARVGAPQILIIERELAFRRHKAVVTHERPVRHVLGTEILLWAEQGALLTD